MTHPAQYKAMACNSPMPLCLLQLVLGFITSANARIRGITSFNRNVSIVQRSKISPFGRFIVFRSNHFHRSYTASTGIPRSR